MLRTARTEKTHGDAMSFDSLRSFTLGDRLLLGGSAIVLLSLLLPWWDDGLGHTATGFHDWGWLSFLSLLLVVAMLAVRHVESLRHIAETSIGDAGAYMLAGVAQMAGAVVFWVGNNGRAPGHVRYAVFVCVVGGAVTVAGGYLKMLEDGATRPDVG
jgi:hypothetical protein